MSYEKISTKHGIAHRLGSIIIGTQLAPTEREYSSRYEYCLKKTKGICGACIRRCPAGALFEDGHDKVKCFRHMRETVMPKVAASYGVELTGCDFCQTKVPCETMIPGRK